MCVPASAAADLEKLTRIGVELYEADFGVQASLVEACRGSACVISALSGLREVIVDAQTQLLNAAVEAGVPRFIPSDFSIDYTKLDDGSNRNLDLRREFMQRVDEAPIKATTIFNGAFTDILLGQAPIVISKFHRILHWGDAGQPLDFTTMDDTASFTADAALDDSAPRFLRISGDTLTPKGIAAAATRASGDEYKTFRQAGFGCSKQ